MTPERWRETVDRNWAYFFGLEPNDVRIPGIRVVTDAPGLDGYRGIYLLRIGDACLVGAPPDLRREIEDRTGDRGPDELFTRESAAGLLRPRAGLVLGPSIHSYVDAETFVPAAPCEARRLGPEHARALGDLQAAVPDDQWAEGGFVPIVEDLWGIFEEGTLVCAGNMSDFADAPADVGLVTHPNARGRGLATALAGAMTANALETIGVIRYRALEKNLPSRAVCRKLGFTDDGANIAVRLRGG